MKWSRCPATTCRLMPRRRQRQPCKSGSCSSLLTQSSRHNSELLSPVLGSACAASPVAPVVYGLGLKPAERKASCNPWKPVKPSPRQEIHPDGTPAPPPPRPVPVRGIRKPRPPRRSFFFFTTTSLASSLKRSGFSHYNRGAEAPRVADLHQSGEPFSIMSGFGCAMATCALWTLAMKRSCRVGSPSAQLGSMLGLGFPASALAPSPAGQQRQQVVEVASYSEFVLVGVPVVLRVFFLLLFLFFFLFLGRRPIYNFPF